MNQYMKVANDLAKSNLNNKFGGPFGACIVKDGKIIGKGSNHVIKNNDPTAHAEIVAIRAACQNIKSYDLSNCIMYTSCYPCPMCLSAIIWSNIKLVYYGNTSNDAAKIGFRDDYIYDYLAVLSLGMNNNDILTLKNIDRSETIKAFEDFNNQDNKTIY